MVDLTPVKGRIEENIGPIHTVLPITKGFSDEKKYRITTDSQTYLLRESHIQSYTKKQEEFNLMKIVHEAGVRCNEPIDIFAHEHQGKVYSLFHYLRGYDAEDNIARIPQPIQYDMGVHAGQDLKKINRLSRDTHTWKHRKWKKHEYYLQQYTLHEYSFRHDEKVCAFIENHYNPVTSHPDFLQHDDFHLGNIIIDHTHYIGVLDFNRYDWGDPLHEFVKLEWFTWPISQEFVRGQVEGYFGDTHISEDDCLQICVYLAMSIVSTIVWTLRFHPHTLPHIEKRMQAILEHYDYFGRITPDWIP